MTSDLILLCGGTGELGGAIACRLHDRGIRFRALVRPATDATRLHALASEIVRGDFRDAESLRPAVEGVGTIVSTVNAIGRLLTGAGSGSIRDVDDRGYANLIATAEQAGVERFVYVSMLGEMRDFGTPFTDAKAATEARLRDSSMREVIVRPDAFQEVWLGPLGGFDLEHGKATIYGKGNARHRFVAVEDVAEAVVRLALAGDPPRSLDLASADAISPNEALDILRQRGRPLRARHIPRLMMRVGRVAARPFRPELASIMGMALVGDLADTEADERGFRDLGIDPQPPTAYLATVVSAREGR